MVFAEVVEDAASEITHCLLQPFQQANLTIPAIVTKLPARYECQGVQSTASYWVQAAVKCKRHCMHRTPVALAVPAYCSYS